MRVCFLVLAHHQPRVFEKLIRHIAWRNSDVLVHVDQRANIAEFYNPGLPNVHFIRNRARVHWSGWSLTRTLCETLEAALRLSRADYFIHLAGTDFPVAHPDAITTFLDKQYPANFLNYYPLVPGIWGYGLIERYRLVDLRAWLVDARGPFGQGSSGVRERLAALVTRAENELNRRLLPRNTTWIDFYSGSSRWCLNRDTAAFAVSRYRSCGGRRLRNYLRFAVNSDEVFFQTSILNSRHKEQCIGFQESESREIFEGTRRPMPDEKRVYFHYIDWSPEREDPAILVESDFGRLRESGKFFACKFVDERSLRLIALIERDILRSEHH